MGIKTNIIIDQGATFSESFELLDIEDEAYDITNWSGAASMKKWYTSTSNSASFTVSLEEGSIALSLTASQTGAIEAGRYVYDVVLTNSITNEVKRIAEGIATVRPGVTLP